MGASRTVTIGITGTLADGVIPSSIARDTELPTTMQLLTPTQRSTIGRFPTFVCGQGQILKMGGLNTFGCASDLQRGSAYIDGRMATWARFNSPTGTVPANILGVSPANGEFLIATGSTATTWRYIQESDLPGAVARDAEIENWALIANSITRIPRNKLGAAPGGGFNTGSNRYFLATGSGVNVGNVEWVNTIPRNELEVSLVYDVSSFSMAMTRRDISTAVQQITIGSVSIDPQHPLTVNSNGCIVVGTGGGGIYNYSASIKGTPNLLNDSDPTDNTSPNLGPMRISPTYYIRRTRNSANQDLDLTRNSHYYRGYIANQTPASYWSRFNGVMIAASGDVYCVMVDATADGAHQADYLTLSDGEIVIISQRIG